MTCSASTLASPATLPLLCSARAPSVLPSTGGPPAIEEISLRRVLRQPNRHPGTHARRSTPSSPGENRQPDRRLVRRRPRHAVLLVGRDGDPIPHPHLDEAPLKLEPGGALEDHHPLVLRLVVPEAVRGPVTERDDSLDSDAMALLENRGEFLGKGGGEIGEEVGSIHISAKAN
jgi:hypothetical protein